MEYADFETEYKRVFEAILNGRRDRDLSADIARLQALAERIDDEDDREDARLEVAGIEDAIAHGPGEPPSEVILQAREAYAEASGYDGTVAERLARAEEGMQALERISAGATPDEKAAIGALEHTLQMLIGGLHIELR
jgi:regulator of protease activity HflC (stomatin/prohibitin superfamily)